MAARKRATTTKKTAAKKAPKKSEAQFSFALDTPTPRPSGQKWGNIIERERRRRIKVSLAAYAYECRADSIMSDAEFDKLCREITPSYPTGNDRIDKFFREHFDPSTGMWIRLHPEFNKIASVYDAQYAH